ncbi:MAG: D-alanyl-D-alanine carboxypeptidase [Clostridiales bacterium]|nr:D-alanyl-D-alanine carboxypeptidase [Clostridiales bacterium]
MKYRYRYLSTMIIVALIVIFIPSIVLAQDALAIEAPNGILIDYETGKVLFDKNAHKRSYPASTTKIMTAVLVLENADLNDRVTIDYDLYVDGSSMFLLKGESFTVEELLRALLIKSANDCAEALAIHISGSVEKFVGMMNKRAKELGALNTNFTNPHGLPDPDHVTTAYDLAMIAKHAMTFDLFREIVSTTMLSLNATEQTPETRIYRNTNKFLWAKGGANTMVYNKQYTDFKYDIIDGIKTGYTGQAKHCLVSTGSKNNYRVISVILGAENESILYRDSRTLIDYGHNNFKLVQLSDKNSPQLSVDIKNGKDANVDLFAKVDKFVVLPINKDTGDIIENIAVNKNIKAPISRGQVLGRVFYFSDNEPVGEVDLIAKNDVEKKGLSQRLLYPLLNPPKPLVICICIFLLWQIFVAYLRIKKRRRRKFAYRKGATTYTFNKNLFK